MLILLYVKLDVNKLFIVIYIYIYIYIYIHSTYMYAVNIIIDVLTSQLFDTC